jgi:hypothetical protein
MRYFAMGDSNMIGVNTDPKHRNYGPSADNFFNIVAKHFDFKFDCFAKNGASNEHIIRITEQWINNTDCDNKEKFVFIGWSTWERQEYLIDNQYYDIDGWLINNAHNLPPELEVHMNQLNQKIKSDPNFMDELSQDWAKRIHAFAKSLEERGIGYFFWNAYMKLLPPIDLDNFQFDHRYLMPYTDCFNQYFYLKKVRNYNPFPEDPYHFDSDGHRLWAEFLIQYINDWKILQNSGKNQ